MYNDLNIYGDAGDSDDHPTNTSQSSNTRDSYDSGHSPPNIISSLPTLEYDSLTDIIIDDVGENETTSAILCFCKNKFLRPYIHLLNSVGLRPMTVNTTWCQSIFSHIQTVFIFLLLCSGYFLQYSSSFRRDRGFTSKAEEVHTPTYYIYSVQKEFYKEAFDFGQILFVYILPSLLHLFGFLAAVYVFRIADNESLQNLVERVFLMSTAPKRLCITLWLYVLAGLIWLICILIYLFLLANAQSNFLQIQWFGKPSTDIQLIAKIFLILTIFVHDFVQIIVLTSYCIECYLLRLHLYNLKEKLVQHTIGTLDWMREVLEFRKLLTHLNRKVAMPICFFTILNLSYSFAGLIYLFKEYDFNFPVNIFSLSIANVFMWLIIGLMPFFQAAFVTRACRSIQASGHQIRIRPFVYHNTSSEDLDSTLLFASSLNMSAKLYRMPIQSNYLYFSILIISIITLTLGMCLNVSLGIV